MDNAALIELLLLEEEEDFAIINHIKKERTARIPRDIFRKRKEEGFFQLLINGHLKLDIIKFREFFRLNLDQFNYVLSLVECDLQSSFTNIVPDPICPKEKLALTLRFLATGESYRSLAFSFRISHSYISRIVREVLAAMCKHLVPIFLPPLTKDVLKKSMKEFNDKWNFPNCVGAIDGKHIRMFCPKNSASLYFNNKRYFSVVLLALVDADYKFLAVDIGSYGKEGDSGIFNKSAMGETIISGEFFPPNRNLPNSERCLPPIIVGDEAFRLRKHIMSPYSRKQCRIDRTKLNFNFRLSRARRVSENAFSHLSQSFRIFYSHIAVQPETSDKIITACCCLHNLLRSGYLEKMGRPQNILPEEMELPENFRNFVPAGGFAQSDGFKVREEFNKYFMEEGKLSWR